MQSKFEKLARVAMMPTLFDQFGIDAQWTNSDGDEVTVAVILGKEVDPVGGWGDLAESRHTLDIDASMGAKIGDTFSVENDPTDDDAFPDPTVWTARQLISDDGLIAKFAVTPGY